MQVGRFGSDTCQRRRHTRLGTTHTGQTAHLATRVTGHHLPDRITQRQISEEHRRELRQILQREPARQLIERIGCTSTIRGTAATAAATAARTATAEAAKSSAATATAERWA